ncbi:MAG: class I tRNA ligase family protein, partial [Salinivirgaceae bacterium]|nr:class I tRNA ligase family protein [Salinivirgaceae bacterium]
YGADSLRLYEMFMGPLDAVKPWAESGVKGVFNFLARVFRFFSEKENVVDGLTDDSAVVKELHKTIKKVADDIENLRFNTAISQMMIFTNACYKAKKVSVGVARDFAKILAPFAPHLAEELWQMYGGTESLAYEPWPALDESKLTEDVVTYPVSFNGKTRFMIELPVGTPVQQVQETALSHESAAKWLDGKTPKKVIVVPNKIVNVVI